MTNTVRLFYISLIISLGGCAGNLPKTGVPMRVGSENGAKVHEIPLERYLVGVLEKEVVGTWPIEALKAQAVASRTYALYRKAHPRDERFDLAADTSDQVFEKKRRHSPAIVEAVLATEGETLKFDGDILQAFFHSCCGGMSERADRVWEGIETPSLLTVHPDPFCGACPRSRWEYSISRKELEDRLKESGQGPAGDWKIEITKRDDSGRVLEVQFRGEDSDISFSGAKFREVLGYTKLPSTLFEITDAEDPVVFVGRGSGHGVGLCQWGAKGMAEEGHTYREILEFYYPGAELVNGGPLKSIGGSENLPDLPTHLFTDSP
jgi:stage II sporulation protein D